MRAMLIDEEGQFSSGKAPTTPEDESVGFENSVRDAAMYLEDYEESIFPSIQSCVYSGTAMLNRLVERDGRHLGVIVTKGMEDYELLGRGKQSHTGFSYTDRLHAVSHEHVPPLVSRDRVEGATERIDESGDVAIPLYEHEVREASENLLEKDIEGLCLLFLNSYENDEHEQRAGEIIEEVQAERDSDVPLFLSSEVNPIWRDFPRLNTTLIEAYAADPSREDLQNVQGVINDNGGDVNIRIMASHGGNVSVNTDHLVQTLVSGPIGGINGAKYIGNKLGFDNIICSDVGGTSFDLGVITDGYYTMETEPILARRLLNFPMISMESIGAGTGTFLEVDPTSERLELSEQSAGSDIGVCYLDSNVNRPTITDCSLIMGILNPDNFLGGNLDLDKDLALQEIENQLAGPLRSDPYETAEGAIDIMETRMKDKINAVVFGRGYSTADYTLLSYGGGGPVHVAGYCGDLEFDDIIVPAWAAAFSAFGCACGDYSYRYNASANTTIPPDVESSAEAIAEELNEVWNDTRQEAIDQFQDDGYDEDDIEFEYRARMQYVGQVEDIEINYQKGNIKDSSDLRELINTFETQFGEVFSRAATMPENGYQITQVATIGKLSDVAKPTIPSEPVKGGEPTNAAHKETRGVYWSGKWQDADVWDMDELQAGNEIEGLSIIEHPMTTYVIPPKYETYLDEHRLFHLKKP